jgi:ABC-type transport system involved in cytochrome c biogenesis permease subunit
MTLAALAFGRSVGDMPPELKTLVAIARDSGVSATRFRPRLAVSLIYLLQERYLKHKKSSALLQRLPSLESLDRLNYRLLVWGFPLMTLGIITGSLWAGIHWGDYWSWEPRQISSGLAWLFYGALLHARITAGLRGKKAAILTMFGFCVVLGYFLMGDSLFPGRHGGRFE